MKRHTIRAVVLSALLVTSIVAGVPIGTATATTTTTSDGTDHENWEPTGNGTSISGEQWPQGFAEHDGSLYVGGGYTETVYVLDESLSVTNEHALSIQPSGMTRHNGTWLVASGAENVVYQYDDGFTNREVLWDNSTFATTEFNEAPWNLDAHDGDIYVADAGEIAVFNGSDYTERERIGSPYNTTISLHIAGDSLYLTGDAGETVTETTLEGDVLETYDIGGNLSGEANGMGLYNGKWYVGDLSQSEEIVEFHAEIDRTETISGRVTDQSGSGVSNATVIGVGAIEGGLESTDPGALEREAEDLLADLENPLPAAWDPDYDLDSHTDTDATYALVHESDDWGVGTTHIADSSVEEPRLTVSQGSEVTLSLWDGGADGGWIENQVDGSFPGATTAGEIQVEQLAGSGDTLETRTYETSPIATTTGANPLTERDHHGVRTTLPVGIYRVAPADGGAGYVFSVGDPDEIASAIADDMRDEAGQLTQRAERVSTLLAEETIVRETVRTDSEGRFEMQIDERAVSVQLTAMKADGTVLEGVTDPSLEDLREARLSGYNGSVYLPAPDGQPVAPPAEGVAVDVYRADSIPSGDIESFADLQALLEDQRLNETVAELRSEYDQRFDQMERQRLESVYQTHRGLVETVPGAESAYLNRSDFEAIRDADELGGDELARETDHMQRALATAATVDPPSAEDISLEAINGTLDLEYTLPDGVDPETLAPEIHYPDGSSETVVEEHYHVDEGGWFSDDELVVDDAPIDGEAGEVRVVGAGEDGLLDDRVPIGEVGALEAVQFSTLAPGPDERVSVGVDGREIVGHEVVGPDGAVRVSNLTDGRVRFDTGGVGVYDLRLTVSGETGEYVVRESVRALENPRSEPATVRIGEGVGGEYAVVGEVLESAEIETERGTTSVMAVAPGDEASIGSLHVKPDAGIDVRDHALEVSVVQGSSERALQTNVEVVVHFDSYGESAVAWRNDDAVLQGGGTRFGEVTRPNGESDSSTKAIIRTYTDSDGSVTIRTVEQPNLADRIAHWADARIPEVSWPLAVGQTFIGEKVVA
ncbi:hypothetical protein HTZ84_22215 [Haloterrigena sp. SYSU A558-1]|uniref:Uncharacterized protein n=1 Tax=Haloterrigena gelatinilytica TaxID=2741724 RepID=A0ABX2LFE7_9EURY|nr:hypothetical protein [Haloterrigena gelatinilytica]NUC74982.1 hypothetical protein [Haloterrigena gelatinilytica]